jgi:tetratricopeptide (TPR) repeat protein
VSLLVLLVSAPVVQNNYVDWDDEIYLSGYAPAHLGLTWQGIVYAFTSVKGTYWQPLTWLSFEADVATFGTSLPAHHLISSLLHALTAGLLALLLRRLGAGPYLALAGSAFWALHPLRVESFAWIAERKDVLFAFFVVAALVLYTRYAESPSLKRFLLWLGCAFLALMSKPTAMVLPVILILLDWWPLHRIRIPAELPQTVGSAGSPAEAVATHSHQPPSQPPPSLRSRRRSPSKAATAQPQPAPPSASSSFWSSNRWLPLLDKIPVALAALGVFVVTVVGQGAGMLSGFGIVTRLSHAVVAAQGNVPATGFRGGLGFAGRLSNAAIGYVRYLGMVVWPVSLGSLYPYPHRIPPVQIALSVLLLAIITFATVYEWRRRPWLLMGWLWFLLTFLPNPAQALADRFTEIPMIGLVIALTWSVSEILSYRPEWKKPFAWGAVVALAALSVLTVRQIGYWRDSETLFRHTLAISDSEAMRSNLALTLEKQERFAEAETEFKAAISLDPRRSRDHNNYALLLIRMNRPAEAVAEAQTAYNLEPQSALTNRTLAQALLRRADLDGAFTYYDRAVALGGDVSQISAFLNDYGASLARKGEFGDAERIVRKAVQFDPTLLEARRNLVLVLIKQHRNSEARAALDQAIAQTGQHHIYQGLASQVGAN